MSLSVLITASFLTFSHLYLRLFRFYLVTLTLNTVSFPIFSQFYSCLYSYLIFLPDEALWAKRRLFLVFLFVYVTNISVYFKPNYVYSSIIIDQARFGAAASSSVSADFRDSSSWVYLHLFVTAASFLTFSHISVTLCSNYGL